MTFNCGKAETGTNLLVQVQFSDFINTMLHHLKNALILHTLTDFLSPNIISFEFAFGTLRSSSFSAALRMALSIA